ncbi:VWA domain-containing protein [Salibacteraceae bacterium]|jgi:Ca-activated chloride channel family protein|nr:VWA domain-containing protein [Salibacteraceae bacterium]
MIRFEHFESILFLLAIPLTLLVFWWYQVWKKKALESFANQRFSSILIQDYSRWKQPIKYLLFATSIFFLTLGLSNPQMGTKLEEVKRKGVDLMIAIDLSNSMLAEDIKPNRLQNSKRAISRLLERLRNDRIGLVVFGGEAYTQLPLTTDYGAAKMFLRTIDTDIIPVQGTDIGKAIRLAKKSFDPESPTSKSIIVITDGENHEEEAIEAATEASAESIVVHTIGMGTTKGAPIPLYRGGRNVGYRKDNEGNSVVSSLNENTLIQIAQAGGGQFVRATNSGSGLDLIFDEIERMEQAEFGTKVYSDYEDRFQYFIGIGLFFLLLEILVFERKNRFIAGLNLFGKNEQ